MNLNLNCILCNIRQVLTVTELLNIEAAPREAIMREVLAYLHAADYRRSNPEIIGGTWKIITRHVKNENPYQAIKRYYNQELSKSAAAIKAMIQQSPDTFAAALKIAITANLIDFAANHSFDETMLLKRIAAVNEQSLAIDDSKSLYEKLKTADTLLYLGDNCGEIVLDKIFIEHIKKIFPQLTVYFGVRGKPIVNDVTLEDAQMVQMADVAEVISNGDDSLGTVINRTAEPFRRLFYQADVIIAKGQGNFESLSEIDRSQVFFLFMAKCEAVANALQVANLSILCAENRKNGFSGD